MAGERAYPLLPCPDLDEAMRFYEALGFTTTYQQRRPNPHAVVEWEDLGIHLAGIDGFDPATSYGSAIITVPDPDGLHARFAAGLRERYGRVQLSGIPRLLRPRRKAGTATGFSVVDVGGNWLRFYRTGATEEDGPEGATGLRRAIEVAARQGDSRGDDTAAVAVLDAALVRHADAAPQDRFDALLYRAELRHRLGEDAHADLATAAGLLDAHRLGPSARTSLDALREATGS